jgi:hypothetical protein
MQQLVQLSARCCCHHPGPIPICKELRADMQPQLACAQTLGGRAHVVCGASSADSRHRSHSLHLLSMHFAGAAQLLPQPVQSFPNWIGTAGQPEGGQQNPTHQH